MDASERNVQAVSLEVRGNSALPQNLKPLLGYRLIANPNQIKLFGLYRYGGVLLLSQLIY
jgi:hypothetical protein